MFDIKIEKTAEAEKTFAKTRQLPANVKAGMRMGLYQYGSLLRKNLREEIKSKDKSGRLYFVYKKKRKFRHIASAPHETPASISGTLRKSVDFKVEGYNRMQFGYKKSVDGKIVDYGKYLEEGTKKMIKRPGLMNTLDNNQINGKNIIRNEINKKI
jgi:hypothetical protein